MTNYYFKTLWDKFTSYVFRKKSLYTILYVLIIFCITQLGAISTEEEINKLIENVKNSYPNNSWQYYSAQLFSIWLLKACELTLKINLGLIVFIGFLILFSFYKNQPIVNKSDNFSGKINYINLIIQPKLEIGIKEISLILFILCSTVLLLIPRDKVNKLVGRDKVFTEKSQSFKVLILPFHPDKNCNVEDTNYEKKLLEKYKSLIDKNSLNINFNLLRHNECVYTNTEAQRIANYHNADLIIWGDYDESCDGPIKVRIKYLLTDLNNPYLENSKKIGDTDMQQIKELDDLKSGELTRDIDDIIFSIAGMSKFSQNDYKNTLNYLKKVTYLETNGKLLEYSGICHNKMNEYEKSIKTLNQALKLDSTNSNVYYLLGRAYKGKYTNFKLLGREEGKRDSFLTLAKEYYQIACKLKDNVNSYDLIELANINADLDLFEEALSLLNEAIRINPKNWYCHYSIANILSSKMSKYQRNSDSEKINDQIEKIKDHYLQALFLREDKKGKAHIYYKISNIYIHRAPHSNLSLSLAYEYINKAISIDSKNPTYFTTRGSIYKRGNYYQKGENIYNSLRDFSTAIQLDSNNFSAYWERAYFYKHMDNLTLAIEDLNKCNTLAEKKLSVISHTTILEERANLYFKNGQFKKAFIDINKVIKERELNKVKVNKIYNLNMRINIAKELGEFDLVSVDSIKINKLLEELKKENIVYLNE
ncbi:tetratricopeptide repeat protein [Flavivirga eckloniae]|uniref:Uncharacterized protein n=1 Tax=Flavivirga eckloniae TaxID=1803846 RepID=A0A2K9PRP7_9FLAO|nr:tetratricopeptide repeat protein [Flavivirga eckloniae]AUP79478.1 hypothetical protein C1H87_12480 [Flavivirga eckloniae]